MMKKIMIFIMLSAFIISSGPVPSAEASKLGRTVKLMAKVFKGKRSRIAYGKQKNDGFHDLRYNKRGDRTPAQKRGDKKRRKLSN